MDVRISVLNLFLLQLKSDIPLEHPEAMERPKFCFNRILHQLVSYSSWLKLPLHSVEKLYVMVTVIKAEFWLQKLTGNEPMLKYNRNFKVNFNTLL